VLLTGEVGTGKTTICRSLLERIPENVDVAFILNPRMSVEDLLKTICEEFHIDVANEHPGIKTFVDALNARLLSAHAQGRSAILIVDEAQNLDASVLEQLRLLTNLETNTRKLLKIFLIGQPELQTMLARPEMRQVSQRVIARYHLSHLGLAEVSTYIEHRLHVSGASPLIFPESLVKQVYRASRGVPRLINLICDRALLGAYAKGQQQISKPILRQAAKEVLAANPHYRPRKTVVTGIALLIASMLVLFVVYFSDIKHSWFRGGVANSHSTIALVDATSAVPQEPESATATPAVLPLSQLKWPENINSKDSEMLAFQSLSRLYGFNIDPQSREAPCRQVDNHSMHCFAGRGGLSDLFQLDQPVVMQLASEGKEYYATLTNLDHQAATLMVGGVPQRIALSELGNAWLGQYIVIWNSPPNFNGHMTLHYHGSAVTWLRQALEKVDGIRDNGSNVFDAELTKRIRTFQVSDGIQPDGLVGPLTVIRLNLRNGKGGPRLVTEKKG
jgi:general secretion pathway protein A